MGPGFNVSPAISRKLGNIFGGRLAVYPLLLAALAAAALAAYSANFSRLSLRVEGAGGLAERVNVYGISSDGKLFDLEKKDGAWELAGRKYARRLLVALPKNRLADINLVRAAAGTRVFEFKARDFYKLRALRLGNVDGLEWEAYELPYDVRDHKSLFPNFAPANWRGDAAFLLGTAGRFLLYALVLVLFRALLRPKGTGPAAGPANLSARPLPGIKRSRELALGRPFHLWLVFLLTAGIVGALSFFQVDPHHDGIMLKPALDAAAGLTLFRDTFTQYGALTVWVQALALKAFGPYLLTLRLLTAFTYGLAAVLMWLVYSRFLPAYLNTFSCLAWLFLGYFFLDYPAMFVIPSATSFAVCSILLGLHLILRFLENGRLRELAAAGAVTALTFWFKINYGAAALLSFLAALLILRPPLERRSAAPLAVFTGGWLAVHALFAGWLALHGSLRDFALQSVKFALAFSGGNDFATGEPPALSVIKSLLQIDSPHGGISFLWLALPLAACAVFLRSAYLAAAKKGTAEARALTAVSAAALGLWLGYYPISALFHMYLSSVLFFGLFAYLALAAARRFGVADNRLLLLAALTLVFLPDLRYRLRSFMHKTAWYSSMERIERPGFLLGMYVPPAEKRAYEEMGEISARAPGGIINLTNSGLYPLYKGPGANSHKMYMDWGWPNSYLYPDYLPAVARQLQAGAGCLFSHDTFMVPGYVPVKVFPAFTGGETSPRPVVALLPGRKSGGLRLAGVDAVSRPGAYDRFTLGYRFRLKASGSAAITSAAAKIISEGSLQAKVPRLQFEYDLLPRIFDPAARELVRRSYLFDAGKNAYGPDPRLDAKARLELMDALSGAFLYEKNSFLADTFQGSVNPQIDIYRNGRSVGYGGLFDGAAFKPGDSVDLVVPAAAIEDRYVAVLRLNFKDGTYQEEKIKVLRK